MAFLGGDGCFWKGPLGQRALPLALLALGRLGFLERCGSGAYPRVSYPLLAGAEFSLEKGKHKKCFRVSFTHSSCSFYHMITRGQNIFSGVDLRNPRKLEEGPGGWGFARVFLCLELGCGMAFLKPSVWRFGKL